MKDTKADPRVLLGYGKRGPIYKAMGGQPDELEQLAKRQGEILSRLDELNDAIDKTTRSEAKNDAEVENRSNKLKDQQAEWDKLQAEFDANEKRETEIKAGIEERKSREAKLAEQRSRWSSVRVDPSVGREEESYQVDFRSVGAPGGHKHLQTRAKRILDDSDLAGHLRADQQEHLRKLIRMQNGDTDGELLAAFMIATSNPHYRSAFQKATTSQTPAFTNDESRAINEVNWLKRAMAIGTQGTGGFAVPVVIDPTVILTAQGSLNPILNLARVETITNDRWRGLSSAGVSWKFDAEASASTDNSPTVTQPVVPTYRADGFIPYSIEVGMDWPGFAEDMSTLLASGYDELLADKLTTGSAANTPTGLIARLAQQTSPVATMGTATAGTIAPADVYKLWGQLPQRHRTKTDTAFMSSTDVQSAVRQLGTLDPNFTVDITQESLPRLFGRQYPMNDYMAAMPTGTAAANLAVVGNFRGFLVAQRAGMNIEFIPMLFDVTNNRPTGQRGWFAWARVGSDVIDPTAFKMLQNKTS